MATKCTCGRSTTGDCMDWHSLTSEEYERVRMEYEIREIELRRNAEDQLAEANANTAPS